MGHQKYKSAEEPEVLLGDAPKGFGAPGGKPVGLRSGQAAPAMLHSVCREQRVMDQLPVWAGVGEVIGRIPWGHQTAT